MRFSILAAITATALASAAPANAEQWWVIGLDKQKAQAIELDSVVKTPTGTRRVWSATIYANPVPDVPAKDIHVFLTLTEYNCEDARWRTLQGSFLTKEMDSRSTVTPPPPEWSYVAPGTAGSVIQNAICREPDKSVLLGPWPNLSGVAKRYFEVISGNRL